MLLTKKKEKTLNEKVLVFLLKTASTVQLCFYVSGPFSQVLSHMNYIGLVVTDLTLPSPL